MKKVPHTIGIFVTFSAIISIVCGLAASLPEAMAGELSSVTHQTFYVLFTFALGLASAGCGLAYFLAGGTKKAAPLYKFSVWIFFHYILTLALYLFTIVARCPGLTGKTLSGCILSQACILATFACTAILAFAPNLGKRRSLFLATMAVLTNAVPCVFGLVNVGTGEGVLGNSVFRLDLIIAMYLMVVAKYEDKDARGTV